MYKLSDFDFHLPDDLIAQRPASPRDHARLLVYDRRDRSIRDDYFYNLDLYLPKNSTIVLNNSRVEKARIVIDNVEIFVLRQMNTNHAEALVRPGKKFRKDKVFSPVQGIEIKTLEVQDDGVRIIHVSPEFDNPVWDQYRLTPFPPYIAQNEDLSEEYQTVYAKDEGSKAAPTAGLHFTDELLSALRSAGHPTLELTLHVGLGTFAPVKSESIDDHIMHSEWFSIHPKTAQNLFEAEHITAVGTTSARTLESIVSGGYLTGQNQGNNSSETSNLDFSLLKYSGVTDTSGATVTSGTLSATSPSGTPNRRFIAGSGSTDIFIKPGYQFKAVDSLITNFHLPKSTLLMLISALTGIDEMHRIYSHAISQKYRFYSFGDAMLII
jgi:S-adenosylmethionine:tRNA ribosyltransferase-isomerase